MKTNALETDIAKMKQDITRYQAIADYFKAYEPSVLGSLGKLAQIAGLWFAGHRGPLAYFKEQAYAAERNHVSQLKSAEKSLAEIMENLDSAFRLIPVED